MTPRLTRARTLVPALGLASLAVLPTTASAASQDISMQLRDDVVGHGRSVVASGRVAGADVGRQLLLQHAGPSGAWTTVAAAGARSGGRYRLRAKLPVSGRVRVVERSVAAAAGASSAPVYVRVVARVVSLRGRRDVLAGRSATVAGAVRPARPGMRVELQRRSGGRWLTVDRDRTSTAGRFSVARRLASPGTQRLRLRVRDTPAGVFATQRSLGTVSAYRRALVSWYGPGLFGNSLGCGGTLQAGTVGVAHKSLPCGTRLTLRHGGREVEARVIDRGPYVGDREFDLTQATKDRLGFSGVGTIWVAPRRAA